MITINVTDRNGTLLNIKGNSGDNLMEILREEDIEGIDAICGGACSCATCHVHLDKKWSEKLPLEDEDEKELLEDSEYFSPTSRLSCQITLTEKLDQLSMTIPPEE